jgi:hypothetical protein
MNECHMRILNRVCDTRASDSPPEKVYIRHGKGPSIIHVLTVCGRLWMECHYSPSLNMFGGVRQIPSHMAMHAMDMSPSTYHVYTLEDWP